MSLDEVDPALLEELAVANRILFTQGVLDGWGHVSIRHPKRPDRFLMSRALAPGLVTGADILEYGLDAEPVEGKGQRTYLERFIHAELYRARANVHAVVHSHSPSVIPFGISTVKLQPCFHMAGFLAQGVPVFEIRDTAGDETNLMITDGQLGAALAKTLGSRPVALMRGHGNIVVGRFLEEVVARAIYTEVNARLQAVALTLGGGPLRYLSHGEGAAMEEVVKGQGGTTWSYGRAYEIWKRQALGAPLA